MPTATYLVDHLAAGEEKFKIGRGWRWAGPKLLNLITIRLFNHGIIWDGSLFNWIKSTRLRFSNDMQKIAPSSTLSLIWSLSYGQIVLAIYSLYPGTNRYHYLYRYEITAVCNSRPFTWSPEEDAHAHGVGMGIGRQHWQAE